MNPFGFFSVISGAMDAVAHLFGKKRRKETRRERISFAIAYTVLWLLCAAVLILVVRELYFRR